MTATRDDVVAYLMTCTDGEVERLLNDARNATLIEQGRRLFSDRATRQPSTTAGSGSNGRSLYERRHGMTSKEKSK